MGHSKFSKILIIDFIKFFPKTAAWEIFTPAPRIRGNHWWTTEILQETIIIVQSYLVTDRLQKIIFKMSDCWGLTSAAPTSVTVQEMLQRFCPATLKTMWRPSSNCSPTLIQKLCSAWLQVMIKQFFLLKICFLHPAPGVKLSDLTLMFSQCRGDISLNFCLTSQLINWRKRSLRSSHEQVTDQSQLSIYFNIDQLELSIYISHLSVSDGQQELYDYCNRPKRNILEVLYDFRHTTPNIPEHYLFDLIPPVKPRSFSIASSQRHHGSVLELLVAVVNYRTVLKTAR